MTRRVTDGGQIRMTEIDAPSGLGADRVAQDGVAQLDTAVWWRYSTGDIALAALDWFLEPGATCCQLRFPSFYPTTSTATPALQIYFLPPQFPISKVAVH